MAFDRSRSANAVAFEVRFNQRLKRAALPSMRTRGGWQGID
jgi:hypothetical protein